MAGGGGRRSVLVTFTVAGVVLVASLAAAILLRPRPSGGTDGRTTQAAATSTADQPVQCDNGPCQLLATTNAGDSTVRLLADTIDPGRPTPTQSGRVQFAAKTGTIVFETNISQDDAVLTRSSLSCLSTGQVPACMVFGEASSTDRRDGALGEVFIERGGYWARPSYDLFYSSAGYFTLWEGAGDTEPEVLTVQNDCGTTKDDQCAAPKVYMQLFSLGVVDATSCTKSVSAISLLPGHGTTKPPAADLRDCPN
ncbi:MAG TPA: hypothetical protein VH352_02105 [Pseudonocardiaceae bacterium]|nr:hypothetical protein [Pseudonocardiaceae bacterium]